MARVASTRKIQRSGIPSGLVTAPAAWFCSTDVHQQNGTVDFWPDRSANGYHLNVVQGGPTVQDSALNGYPAFVTVSGSSQAISRNTTNIVTGGAWSCAVVAKLDALSGLGILVANSTGTTGVQIGDITPNRITVAVNIGVMTASAAQTTSYEAWVLTRASGAAPVFYANGTSQTIGTPVTTQNDPGGSGTLSIGAGGSSGALGGFISSHVCEVVWFSSVLPAADIAAFDQYVYSKYGIVGV